MTENKTIPEFVKHCLTWKFTDEGEEHEATFFLPRGADPHKADHVGSILSVVDLSASEYGHEYNIEAECFEIDDGYICDRREENDDDEANRYENKCSWCKTCPMCVWHDGEDCVYNLCHERTDNEALALFKAKLEKHEGPIVVTGLMGKVEAGYDAHAAKVEAELEIPGHFGYTSDDGEDFENQEVDRMSDDEKAKWEAIDKEHDRGFA